MQDVIYFDNNATTRPHDEVVEAMLPFLHGAYANPSSAHQFGQSARHAVECARAQVAELLHADPKEIVFTAGGTESINLAIRGLLRARPDIGGVDNVPSGKARPTLLQPSSRVGRARPDRLQVVTSTVEHSAVRAVCEHLADEGYRIVEVGVDDQGRLDPDELEAAMGDDTALVSIMWANNETGVLFDIDRIAAITSERGVPLHVDAVQAVGKVPIDMRTVPVQLLSLSAHKFHGPKGVGALYVRRRTRLQPLVVGGHQERDLRGGTEHVAGIVGLGVTAELASRHLADNVARVGAMRDRLERDVCQAVSFARVNGAAAPRVHNTTNIGFESFEAEALLLLLSERGVCASAGAACSSGSLDPSHVLQAMNVDPRYAHGSIRLSLSEYNTEQEVDRFVALLPEVLARLTALTPRS